MSKYLAQALDHAERAAQALDLHCCATMAHRVEPGVPLEKLINLKVDAQELRDEIRKVYTRMEEKPAPRSSAQAGVILTELLGWLAAFAVLACLFVACGLVYP